jgi:uncharacterized protein (TIRG00374 family)
MVNERKRQAHPRLTILAIALMILVGAVIIFLDRRQMLELAGKANWRYLGVTLVFVAASYLLDSITITVMLRVFGVQLNRSYLLRVGLVSSVVSNLIGLPAALALRLLVLGRHRVTQSQNIGSSLLLSYFKNLAFYGLIPVSLIYIIFTYPLVFGGLISIVVIFVILVVALVVAALIVFSSRVREFVFRSLSRIWHFATRRNIENALNNFERALLRGLAELRRQPKISYLLTGLILGNVATMITALWFCFKALSIPVHVGVLITAFNFGITLTIISLIPGDLGVQEASIAGILALFGMPFSQGILVAILFRVLYYFVPFIFSLGFYLGILKEIREPAK